MIRRIYIKGEFELTGNLPGLDKCVKKMTFAEIEIEEKPEIRLVQFSSLNTGSGKQ